MAWLRKGLLASVLVAFTAASMPGAAEGKGRKPNEAAQRFDQMGKKAYGKKRWDDAIASFEAAYQVDPLPRFLYNIARCYEQMGEFAATIKHLKRYLESSPEAEDAADVLALMKIVEIKLQKTTSPIRIETEPPDALIQIKGRHKKAEGVSPIEEWVPFGQYEIVVARDGFEQVTRSVIVKPKTPVELKLKLEPVAKAPPPPPPEPEPPPPPPPEPKPEPEPPPPPPPDPKPEPKPEPKPKPKPEPEPEPAPPPEEGGSSWLAWTALGGGGALLAGAGLFYVFSSQAVTERDALLKEAQTKKVAYADIRSWEDAAQTNMTISTALGIAGGVAILSGVGLLVLGGGDAEEGGGGDLPEVVLVPAPDGVMLVWSPRL